MDGHFVHFNFEPEQLAVTEPGSTFVQKGHACIAGQGCDVYEINSVLLEMRANSTISVYGVQGLCAFPP